MDLRSNPSVEKGNLAGAAWFAFGVTLVVYLATMNRTIGFIDRGELAATTYTLGIPHPTGYPTFTVLGWLVSHLVPLRPVHVLNALAAMLVAVSAAGLVFLFDALFARVSPDGRRRSALALVCALFTAFTIRWWQQATGFEVYSLHLVLLPIVLMLFFRWVDRSSSGFAFAFALGLAFTNHMTTILLAPGLVFYAWARFGGVKSLARAVLPLVIPFLIGLSPYAFLPIRSATGPRFDWDATHRCNGFIDHLTAREYRGWISLAPDTLATQGRYLLQCMAHDFMWIGLIPAGVGVVWLARRDRNLAIAVGLIVVVSAFFAASYQIRELDPYLVGCVLGLALFMGFGMLALHERLGARAAWLAGSGLVVMSLALHFSDCNESQNRLVEDLTMNQLRSMPTGALLFTKQWDYFLAASWYFQEVEHLRPDVLIVSPDLLRHRWYVDELQRRAPSLLALVPKEAAAYREALRPFEEHRSYDAEAIRASYQSFIDSLVARSMKVRPVFCTSEVAQIVGGRWNLVPTYLALALRPDTTYTPETPPPSYTFRPWPEHMDGFVATTHWIYASALTRRAAYERAHGRDTLAREYLSLAARFDPRIRLDAVGPLPMDGNAVVDQTAAFFASLNKQLRP
jgi:hypothetical protein